MNPLPPNADELVSAYLDGQAAPDEIAIVESSSELMARVDQLRTVADLLSVADAPPVEQKEAHISAALDAFDALFSDATELTDQPAVGGLAAVPVADAFEAETAPDTSTVTSLDRARERRRPRRFNPGIIAAAAAAVLLFVALAAFGLGGNDSLDVATDTASSTADDASDAVQAGAMAEGDAMSDEESMADTTRTQLSEVRPSPTVAPPQAAQAAPEEEAMDDDAMDEEEAMDEADAMDDEEDAAEEAANDAGADAAADVAEADALEPLDRFGIDPFAYFVGDFPDEQALRDELDGITIEDLDLRLQLIEPGLFPGCQPDIPELADIEPPTLIGEAVVDDQLVEVHRVIIDDEIMIVLVDATDCTVVPAAP